MSVFDYIHPRSVWNPRYQDGDMTLSGLAERVAAHHSVTTQLPANATREQECVQMRAIESIGQSRFGTGISYNVVIFPSGRAYQGVSFHRRGTHTGGMNSTTRSICFAGNYETNKPTDAQIATAARIYAEGVGNKWQDRLIGHRDVSQTACPGRNVYARLNDIKNGFQGGITPPKPSVPITYVKTLGEGFRMRELNLRLADKTPVKYPIVKKLQGLLLAKGYGPKGLTNTKGLPDGIAGAATKFFVGEFQKRMGLEKDYVVGAKTWTALIEK